MLLEARDPAYLYDMLHHARSIVEALSGCTLAQYAADETLRLSIERRLEIVGEAARRVSEPFRTEHPEIPWRKIVALRNVISHEYGEIDDSVMWHVATTRIPELKARLEQLVPADLT